MQPIEPSNEVTNASLLQAAKRRDQQAFATLSEPYRRKLMLHCYRMLGSLQDAEDMVQDTYLRAWSRLETFDSRSSYRTWLYSIATHACLDLLRRRRSLTVVDAPDNDEQGTGEASPYIPTIDPLPDHLALYAETDPEAAFSARESVSIAFMTLLQNIPPRQRAVLLLRDVLNMQAKEVADYLTMTESAVNSALLRARASLRSAAEDDRSHRAARLPAQIDALLARYIAAWEQHNVENLLALLREDVLVTMPPLGLMFPGKSAVRPFMVQSVFDARGRWKTIRTSANGQPALALYLSYDSAPYFLAGLEVLTVAGDEVGRIDHFIVRQPPQVTTDPGWVRFFGLPAGLEGTTP